MVRHEDRGEDEEKLEFEDALDGHEDDSSNTSPNHDQPDSQDYYPETKLMILMMQLTRSLPASLGLSDICIYDQ